MRSTCSCTGARLTAGSSCRTAATFTYASESYGAPTATSPRRSRCTRRAPSFGTTAPLAVHKCVATLTRSRTRRKLCDCVPLLPKRWCAVQCTRTPTWRSAGRDPAGPAPATTRPSLLHLSFPTLAAARSTLPPLCPLPPLTCCLCAPAPHRPQSNRGNAFRALGNVGAAKAAYDAALLIDPLDSRTWNNRGALQEDVGNLVAAELDLRRSLEIDPSCARAESNRQRIARVLQHADLELQPLRPCSPTDVAAAVGEDPWSIETFTLADGPLGLVIGQAPSGEVEIRSVQPRGQAEGLGIRPGGVVVGLNDASIGPVESSVLTQMVRTAPSPRVLRIRYYSSFSGAAVDEDGVDQLSRSATAKARAEGAGFVPPPGDYADGGVSTYRE